MQDGLQRRKNVGVEMIFTLIAGKPALGKSVLGFMPHQPYLDKACYAFKVCRSSLCWSIMSFE